MKVETMLKAGLISTGLKSVTGYQPLVLEKPDGTALIAWQKEDLPKIRSTLEALAFRALSAKKTPSDISLSLMPVLGPLALKYSLPVLIGIFCLGAVAGYTVFIKK